MATQVLQEVVKRGTGTKAGLVDHQVAGKTGTAEDNSDAWFVGYTPQLATAVWMGNPLKRDRMVIRGTEVTGGSYPATIWGAFMKDALADQPSIDFPPPDPKEIPRRALTSIPAGCGRATPSPRPCAVAPGPTRRRPPSPARRHAPARCRPSSRPPPTSPPGAIPPGGTPP